MPTDTEQGTIIFEDTREIIFERIQSANSFNHLYRAVNGLRLARKNLHFIHPEISVIRLVECAAPPIFGVIGYKFGGQLPGVFLGFAGVPISILAQMVASNFGALVKKEFATYMSDICEKADNLQPRDVKWSSKDIMANYYKWKYSDPVHRAMAYVEKVMEDFFSCVNFSRLHMPKEGNGGGHSRSWRNRPKGLTS